MSRIYLDYAATTPILPEVRASMAPWLSAEFGNPSSLHEEGRRARAAIDQAREALSEAIGCLFAEVLFTSSGTEAANLAIVGAALGNRDSGRKRVLVGAAEHHCVLHCGPLLERLGYRFEKIPVDRIARTRLDALEDMIGPDVLLVSVMHANNELGTIQPVAKIAEIAHRHGSLFHCDAVQTLGSAYFPMLPRPGEPEATLEGLRFGVDGPDLATFSAHKIGGPKGVGAIYVRAGTAIAPMAVGGGQEREMRAGTENVAGIVGFGAAIRSLSSRVVNLPARDVFLDRLTNAGFVPSVPDKSDVVPSHAHVRYPGVDAETLLIRLDRMGVSASSGAACSSGSLEASHVLLACGYSEKEAREGLRFTFGRQVTVEAAEEAAGIVISAASAMAR